MALNLLLVDDSAVMRSIVKRVLGLSGFELGEILEAEDGKQALEVLNEKWVDCVLTDVNMPVMDGVELLQSIKTDETLSSLPVIVVSTEGRSERIKDILDKGAAGYITKPFKPEDIRKTICDALGVDIDENFVEEPEDSDF